MLAVARVAWAGAPVRLAWVAVARWALAVPAAALVAVAPVVAVVKPAAALGAAAGTCSWTAQGAAVAFSIRAFRR